MKPIPPLSSLRSLTRAAAIIAFVLGASIHAAVADTNALFSKGLVPRLRLEISPEGMKVLRGYKQVWGQPRPERIDVKATVREGGRAYTNVAVHLKGSYTFDSIDGKPSFTLNFEKFAPGQTFHGLDKIHLNNSVQDPTYIHEALAREVFNEAGVPAARVGHARATLNGRDLGFYVVVEGANKRFLQRHFASTKGNLYDGGSGGDLASGKLDVDSGENPDDRSSLETLLAAARAPASARFAAMEKVLDVDRFITFAALEVLFVHWDGYCMAPNNYRLFHDASRDKMVFMPHGMDQILAGGASSSTLTPQWKGVVARQLLGTLEGRRRYDERVRQLLQTHFRLETLNAKVDRIATQIRPAVGRGFLESAQFGFRLNNLKSRIASRVGRAQALAVAAATTPEESPPVNPDGTVTLPGWRFRAGPQGNGSGRGIQEGGRSVFEVRTEGPGSSASWRTTVRLGPGSYEFTGMGRVSGPRNAPPDCGVLLRISGEQSREGLSTAPTWTPLSYEFEMGAVGSVELVCEYRGAGGVGSFDASTLKLRRK